MSFHMNELHDIHCLGCKERHPTVVVDEIKILYVKGSPRYQAVGICPEGKKWTKILNKKERKILAHMMPTDEKDSSEVVSESETEIEVKVKETDAPKEILVDVEDLTTSQNASEDDILALFDNDEGEIQDEVYALTEEITQPSVAAQSPLQSTSSPPKNDARKTITRRDDLFENLVHSPEQGDVDEFDDLQRSPESEVANLRRDIRSLHRPNRPPVHKRAAVVDRKEAHNRVYHISAEQAYKYGRHYGYNEATFSGERYREGLPFHFKQSRVDSRFFDAFAQGYLEGGERFLLNEDSPTTMATEPTSMETPNSMGAKTTAGLAAVSIFGAWVAAKMKRGG